MHLTWLAHERRALPALWASVASRARLRLLPARGAVLVWHLQPAAGPAAAAVATGVQLPLLYVASDSGGWCLVCLQAVCVLPSSVLVIAGFLEWETGSAASAAVVKVSSRSGEWFERWMGHRHTLITIQALHRMSVQGPRLHTVSALSRNVPPVDGLQVD